MHLRRYPALLGDSGMSHLAIHTLFDALAWLAALLTLLALRRTLFSSNPVEPELRLGYVAAVLFGAGIGAWLIGSINLWASGLPGLGRSVEGALAGAILAIETWKRWNSITVRTGAVYALPLCVGVAVGRIGCLLSGLEDNTHGIPTGAGWGWDFGDGILRHPVQLYESIAMAAFGLVWLALATRGNAFWRTNGFYLATGFYAAQRFVLEFWKPYDAVTAGLNAFQLLSIGLLVYAIRMVATAKG
jgi:prolipoprotein diacylglyceryltransferase